MVCSIWRLLRGCLETWRKHLYIFLFRNGFPGWVGERGSLFCFKVSQILLREDFLVLGVHLCLRDRNLPDLQSHRQVDHKSCSCQLRWVGAMWVEWSFNLIFFRTPVPIWEIPFPALTLCNMNKVTYTAQGHNKKWAVRFFRFGDPKWTRSWLPWRRTQPTFTSSRRSSSSTRSVTSSFD